VPALDRVVWAPAFPPSSASNAHALGWPANVAAHAGAAGPRAAGRPCRTPDRCAPPTHARTRAHARTHTRTRAHTRTLTRARTRTRTRTRACTRTHARIHAHTHARCEGVCEGVCARVCRGLGVQRLRILRPTPLPHCVGRRPPPRSAQRLRGEQLRRCARTASHTTQALTHPRSPAAGVRVRVEIMGSQRYGIVGKCQAV
jgi:hypothetical protein